MVDQLLIGGFAVWRLSYLLINERGFMDIGVKVRTMAYTWHVSREIVSCIYCLSLWLSIGYLFLYLSGLWPLALPFAWSGAALMVERCLKLRLRSQIQD